MIKTDLFGLCLGTKRWRVIQILLRILPLPQHWHQLRSMGYHSIQSEIRRNVVKVRSPFVVKVNFKRWFVYCKLVFSRENHGRNVVMKLSIFFQKSRKLKMMDSQLVTAQEKNTFNLPKSENLGRNFQHLEYSIFPDFFKSFGYIY